MTTVNDGCSNLTTKGDYAFRVSGEALIAGTSFVGIYSFGVAMTRFDGHGHLNQVDFVMGNGVPPVDQMPSSDPSFVDPSTGFTTGEKGTYQVCPDCTGTATINFPAPLGWTEGHKIKLMFVIGDGDRTIHTVVSSLTLFNGDTTYPNVRSDAERLGAVEDRR